MVVADLRAGRVVDQLLGVGVELDPLRGGDRLPLVDEPRGERAQRRLLADAAVREPGERAERVRRRVEDHLAPLRPAGVGDRLRRHAGAGAGVGEPLDLRRARPACGSNGPSVVSPLMSHWTTPGAVTFPAGNVVPRITRSTCRASTSSLPIPFCTVATDPFANAWAVAAIAPSVCIAFVATMPKSHGGSSAASVVARTLPDDVARAGQAQPVAVDRVDVVAREVVGPDLDVVERPEIGGEQRADRAAADDADLHCHEASFALISRYMAVWSGTGTPMPPALADERARDQLDLGRAVRLDVLEHRGVVARAAPGRVDVHLPGILAELDARGGGNRLALVHQREHEVAEVARLVELRRSAARAAGR